MELLARIGQLLLSLFILVTLHELGHFVAARYFKTRVEKFYLFFNPWFSLFKFRKGKTEYGMGWIPLGGYVKISGMIDESMDKKQMKNPPKPYEFRSKKTWQRLIIILAGVFVNIILGFIIYIGTIYTWGESYLPNDSLKYGIICDSIAKDAGLQNGDKLLTIDGKKIDKFNSIIPKILFDNPQKIKLLRGLDTVNILIKPEFSEAILKKSQKSFNTTPIIQPRILFSPFIIAKIVKNTPASKSNLKTGDEIVGINSQVFKYYDVFKAYIRANIEKEITLNVKRNGNYINIPVSIGKAPVIGILNKPSKQNALKLKQHSYTFTQAIPAGIKKTKNVLFKYVSSLKTLFTKDGAINSLGGIGTMSQIFPKFWNWQVFWETTAFISIMLAFINLLPIPGLDGGHAIFIIYEMITRRKPSVKFMEIAQTIGVIILLGLVIFANGNDILKFLR